MIRQMLDSDWAEVSRIWGESIEAGDATFRTDVPSFESWDSSHEKCCRLIYEEDGKVLGFAVIGSMSGTPAYWGSVEESIYVDRAHRREGIGTKLLKELIKESEEHGYWSLYAIIFSSNRTSIHLHEKCGFRIIGTRDRPAKDKFGRWIDTTLMEYRSEKIV
ncbi:MAG: N-acetyltransferase family protein [archaeon]|nr:N-acetyltransferase family protein [archaeon]